MLIPIKIQCGCGQRYAFEVEAVDGRMPAPVTCPVCGANGTAAANACIAQNLVASVVEEAIPMSAAPHAAARLPGQIGRSQAVTEARAQIFWGEPPEEVAKFLMRQGVSVAEAQELVAGMFQERVKTIRRNGIWKFILGTTMACAPVTFYLVCNHMGIIPMKLFALTIMLGLWGAWMLLKGIIMFFAPKSEPGDVAAQ